MEPCSLHGQFFNDNNTVVFSDFPEACEQNLWVIQLLAQGLIWTPKLYIAPPIQSYRSIAKCQCICVTPLRTLGVVITPQV